MLNFGLLRSTFKNKGHFDHGELGFNEKIFLYCFFIPFMLFMVKINGSTMKNMKLLKERHLGGVKGDR